MSDSIRCGTLAGHRRHVRQGEQTCAPCRAASAAYMRSRRSRPREPRPCMECALTFTPVRNHGAKFCSANCRTKYSQKAARAGFLTARSCEWCEQPFMPGHRDARLCSRPCVNAARKLRARGITGDDYRVMLRRQAHRCAICTNVLGSGRDRHIDHDHETGAVRGILCPPCNLMLGHAKDRPHVLIAAAEYLTR